MPNTELASANEYCIKVRDRRLDGQVLKYSEVVNWGVHYIGKNYGPFLAPKKFISICEVRKRFSERVNGTVPVGSTTLFIDRSSYV